MVNGFITLQRKILLWEWYQDINTKTVFIHLLLNANHTQKPHQGLVIERGQFKTGIKKLSYEIGLSEQKIKTALNKLKLTNEITIKSTNKYSVITLLKYNEYQLDNKQNKPQINNKEISNNNQITTTNKDNTLKNVNTEDTLFIRAAKLIADEFHRYLTIEETQIIEQWVNKDKFTYDEIYESLFIIVKQRKFDLKFMYGILKNRKEQQKNETSN